MSNNTSNNSKTNTPAPAAAPANAPATKAAEERQQALQTQALVKFFNARAKLEAGAAKVANDPLAKQAAVRSYRMSLCAAAAPTELSPVSLSAVGNAYYAAQDWEAEEGLWA